MLMVYSKKTTFIVHTLFHVVHVLFVI